MQHHATLYANLIIAAKTVVHGDKAVKMRRYIAAAYIMLHNFASGGEKVWLGYYHITVDSSFFWRHLTVAVETIAFFGWLYSNMSSEYQFLFVCWNLQYHILYPHRLFRRNIDNYTVTYSHVWLDYGLGREISIICSFSDINCNDVARYILLYYFR